MADLKKGFDLAAALGGVSKLDTGAADGREQIEYINITQIDSDAANFYELSQVDELAANIELFGLQQPLRVRAHPNDPQRVIIVSGHRRRAAIAKLVKDGRNDLTEVPCIRDQAKGPPALQELRLIYANSDTRVLTSAEKGKQAERVEALLYQLKGEGYEFPGRMRDHVAEACKMSQSKLARLKLIRDKLATPWVSYYEKGTLSESTAYTLAQLPSDHQNLIFDGIKKKKTEIRWLYQHEVERYGKQLAAVDEPLTCKKGGEGMCTNREAMKAQVVHSNSYDNPCKSCCDKCDKLSTCNHACPVLADKVKRLRADKKAQRQQEQDAKAAKEAPKIAKIKDIWSRFGHARQAADKTVKTVYEAMDMYWGRGDDQKVSALEQGVEKITLDTRLPYGYSFCLSDAERLINAADILGCSLDYLLGRTDELHGGIADEEVTWHLLPDVPQRDCRVVILVDIGNAAPLMMFAYYSVFLQSFSSSKDNWIKIDPSPAAWLGLPERPVLHSTDAPEDPCAACKAAHPGCNECCMECVEGCNLSQECRREEKEDSDDD